MKKKKVKEPQMKVRVGYDDGSEGFLICGVWGSGWLVPSRAGRGVIPLLLPLSRWGLYFVWVGVG